jgi:hypothetical protein
MIKPENIDLQQFIPRAQRMADAVGKGALTINLYNGTDTFMSGSSIESDIERYKEVQDPDMVKYLTNLLDLVDEYDRETEVLVTLCATTRDSQTFKLKIPNK